MDRSRVENPRETPERSRAAVAQQRFPTTSEDSPHPASLLVNFRSPDRIYTAPEWMQATLVYAVFDRARADPERKQLCP